MHTLNPETATNGETQSDADGTSVPAEVDVVCVFPSAGEAGGFIDKLSGVSVSKCNGFVERLGTLDRCSVGVIETNLPHEDLARIVRDVINLRKPKWVISAGFAVAIDETVRRGAIVVADRIIDEHDYSLNTGTNMPASKGLHVGGLLTRETMPTQLEKKTLLGKETYACETQAAVIAEVSRILKSPMMAIHCVAQAYQQRPSNILKSVKSQDSIAGIVGAAAGALLDQPGSVKEFWSDKEQTLKAADRLAQFLVGVVSQLPKSTN